MKMVAECYDVCVIGGGINGAGVARDAAGRGLSVLLVEARDLASGTSSNSTKLIHGGLRYLEYYEFKMVRDALKERRVLRDIAPHLVHPQELILPHVKEMRPYWLVDMGLFIYDNLASWTWSTGNMPRLPKTKPVNFNKHISGMSLNASFKKGFSYYDCWVDDARLVVANAMSAREHGADVLTRTECEGIKAHEDGTWQVMLRDVYDDGLRSVQAGAVINAAGPWVGKVLERSGLDGADVPAMRLVKGSHIIVKRQYEGDHGYVLQQSDSRLVFALPYQNNYTLFGTTEIEFDGSRQDAYDAEISSDEVDYLCDAFNASFVDPITPEDVIWSYSGVRPLFDDGADDATAATRDYLIHQQISDQGAPLLSIFGGKLTTYREVSQEAMNILDKMQGRDSKPWTATKRLSGGDIKAKDFDDFIERQIMAYPWLGRDTVERFAHSYGVNMIDVIGLAMCHEDLGYHFGGDVYAAELEYSIEHEWVREPEDFLYRRTKTGLYLDRESVQKITAAFPDLVERVLG